MAELELLANGKRNLKFHARPQKVSRVEKLNYKKNFFRIYIDKNDSVYDVKRCQVVTWKTINKGKGKLNVPDEVTEIRDTHLFDRIKGNPYKIAVNKIKAEIELLS